MPSNVQFRANVGNDVWKAALALPPEAKGPVSLSGWQMRDMAAIGMLKAEWLAASAGVVPFVTLPGGGQGIVNVGAALSVPRERWTVAGTRELYLASHKAYSGLHASVRKAARDTPYLLPGLDQASIPGAPSNVPIPHVWVVVAAVGILVTIAASYYAVATKLEQIRVDADTARAAAKVGAISDLASAQLAATGHIDPSLVEAIAGVQPGGRSPWLYVAGGAAATLLVGATAAGIWYRSRR